MVLAAQESEYTVLHKCVFVRDGPSTEDRAIGRLFKGQVVAGCEVNGWLFLDKPSADLCSVEAPAWVLVHGQRLGLGPLLERHEQPPGHEDPDTLLAVESGCIPQDPSPRSPAQSSSGSTSSRAAARRAAQARDAFFDFGDLDPEASQPAPGAAGDSTSSSQSPADTCVLQSCDDCSASRDAPPLDRAASGHGHLQRQPLARGHLPSASGPPARTGTAPLGKVCPGLLSLAQDLIVDFDGKAVALSIGDTPGCDACFWGEVGAMVEHACGVYYPLCLPSGSYAVQMLLGSTRISASDSEPIRVNVGAERGAGASPGFFLVHELCEACVAPEESPVRWPRYRVLNQSGVRVLESSCLRAGAWLTCTSLAEETDPRVHTKAGGTPVKLAPPPAPTLPLSLCSGLQAWVITLKGNGSRDDNVEHLKSGLTKICTELGLAASPVQSFKAWDTRGMNNATMRALCQEFVLLGAVFLHEEGVLVRVEADGEKCFEAGHVRASKVLGCGLSHSDIWWQLASGPASGPWLILEDDAVLNSARPVAAILNAAFAALQNCEWDMLLMGACSKDGGHCSYVGPCTLGPIRQHFFGFWGYAVSKRGAARALRAIWGSDEPGERRALKGDIDCECAAAAASGKLDVYACIPQLVLVTHTNPQARIVFLPGSYEYKLHTHGYEECESTRTCAHPSGDGQLDAQLFRRVAGRVRSFRRAATTVAQ